MTFDPSAFVASSAADTCAVWNVLSSATLLSAALANGCTFAITEVVNYECLVKPRKNLTREDADLMARLRREQSAGRFIRCGLDPADLLQVNVLQQRKSLGVGELSTMAFASRTRQAFLTDDQPARKFAKEVFSSLVVQTTPHILGWLIFNAKLSDSEKDTVVSEHNQCGRPLEPHFQEVYKRALQFRLMATSRSGGGSNP